MCSLLALTCSCEAIPMMNIRINIFPLQKNSGRKSIARCANATLARSGHVPKLPDEPHIDSGHVHWKHWPLQSRELRTCSAELRLTTLEQRRKGLETREALASLAGYVKLTLRDKLGRVPLVRIPGPSPCATLEAILKRCCNWGFSESLEPRGDCSTTRNWRYCSPPSDRSLHRCGQDTASALELVHALKMEPASAYAPHGAVTRTPPAAPFRFVLHAVAA